MCVNYQDVRVKYEFYVISNYFVEDFCNTPISVYLRTESEKYCDRVELC